MTICKKQYIGTDKEMKFDAGNIVYNFSFVVACRYLTLASEGKLVVESWKREIVRESLRKSSSVFPPLSLLCAYILRHLSLKILDAIVYQPYMQTFH